MADQIVTAEEVLLDVKVAEVFETISATAGAVVKEVGRVKVSVIPWHFFFEACEKEKSGELDQWLQQWAFADDGVRFTNGATNHHWVRFTRRNTPPGHTAEKDVAYYRNASTTEVCRLNKK